MAVSPSLTVTVPQSLLHFPNRPHTPRFLVSRPRSSLKDLKGKDHAPSPPPLDFNSNTNNNNGRAPQFLDLHSENQMETPRLSQLSEAERERRVRGGRGRQMQMVARSGVLAKQVISIKSARSLGFISQLWVDTTMWAVALLETRPNLLSPQFHNFLLQDLCQLGDVVLVQDDSVLQNELNLHGLETLVGYNVTTTASRTVGKVRGFTFNINSGAVDFLELDSFGFSLIPSTLVSTYSLLVDDILEVVSDTIVVHEDAVSRLQRMTKGIWGSQNIRQRDRMDAYSEFERRPRPVERNDREKPSGRRSRRRMVHDTEDDDWEFPMEY